jgi:hypothetical protein
MQDVIHFVVVVAVVADVVEAPNDQRSDRFATIRWRLEMNKRVL